MSAAPKRLQDPASNTVFSAEVRSENAVGDALRLAMRELASGVCVITTGANQDRCGFTASSVTSLSLAPPSILLCIQKTSRSLAAILANNVFAVNILTRSQSPIADDFASGTVRPNLTRFDQTGWIKGNLNVPVLAEALAALECRVGKTVDWHTHVVLFGLVTNVHVGAGDEALTYWRGGYCQPVKL